MTFGFELLHIKIFNYFHQGILVKTYYEIETYVKYVVYKKPSKEEQAIGWYFSNLRNHFTNRCMEFRI
jgi:hypothetical protein